jgi:hypothetical protein
LEKTTTTALSNTFRAQKGTRVVVCFRDDRHLVLLTDFQKLFENPEFCTHVVVVSTIQLVWLLIIIIFA